MEDPYVIIKGAEALEAAIDKDSFYIGLVKTVNDGYSRGEAGIWRDPNSQRTNIEEVKQLINDDKMILAMYGNEPVSTIYVDTSNDTACLGMLTAKLEHTGKGLGRRLILAAE